MIDVMTAFVLLLLLVVWVGGEEGRGAGCPLPSGLLDFCNCKVGRVECGNLTSTDQFAHFRSSTVTGLSILSSHIKCLNLRDFTGLENLRQLQISHSNVEHFCTQDQDEDTEHAKKDVSSFGRLESLDLSNNKISQFYEKFKLSELRLLNLSHNLVTGLPSRLPEQLEILDVSFNRLSDKIEDNAFSLFPNTLQYINLGGNPWLCSASLSWLYPWSLTLSTTARLSLGEVKCRILNSERSPPLIVLMETYHRQVLPHCPEQCSCDIIHFGSSTLSHTVYTLQVNCSGKSLSEFPSVPEFTTILDLSNNKLVDASFKGLNVEELNYKDITGLLLSNNQFTYLDNKLLKMKLHRFFKVDGNMITEIPYDVSLMVQRFNTEIYLGGNPWTCSCNSEINNINLLQKLSDIRSVTCSKASKPETIVGYKIADIEPLILCPPSDEGAQRELVLQLVCATLAFLIVIVLSKLMYDYWEYKRRGKLPWIVYKMP